MTDQSDPLFLFGPGYSAQALAALWDGPVFGTVRSEESATKLENTSIDPVWTTDLDQLSQRLSGAHLVVSAPPSEDGCPAFGLLEELAHRTQSITYLSTTGVYGDLAGGWAMDWSPVNPSSDRAKRRVHAEHQWQRLHTKVRVVRLPGIYGPGRSALDRVKAGQARRIVKPGQVFSRIHVDDIATGLKALLGSDSYGAFNLCDEEAAPPQDVIAFAAQLLDVTPPPEIDIEQANLSEMGRSFYAECKRVSNARIKAATGWRPSYPTYREGLRAIASEQT